MTQYIQVHIKPGSGKSEVVGFFGKDNVLKVNLKAQPEGGKANQELVKLLSKHFGKRAAIKSGQARRHKLVVLD